MLCCEIVFIPIEGSDNTGFEFGFGEDELFVAYLYVIEKCRGADLTALKNLDVFLMIDLKGAVFGEFAKKPND